MIGIEIYEKRDHKKLENSSIMFNQIEKKTYYLRQIRHLQRVYPSPIVFFLLKSNGFGGQLFYFSKRKFKTTKYKSIMKRILMVFLLLIINGFVCVL